MQNPAQPMDTAHFERILLARAVVAADAGQFDELERLLLERQYASIREGETLLSDLWVRLQRGRLEADLGRAATHVVRPHGKAGLGAGRTAAPFTAGPRLVLASMCRDCPRLAAA